MDRYDATDGHEYLRLNGDDDGLAVAVKSHGDRWDEVPWCRLDDDDVRSLRDWLTAWVERTGG